MVSLLSTRPDFSSLAEVTVLPESLIEQALRRCQGVTDGDEQWDCYLRSLALAGVRHWLEAGSIPFTIRLSDHQPASITSMLQVNGWRVGVAIVRSLPTEAVTIPRAAIAGATGIDLWLLVEVQEELGQIRVLRGLESPHIAARSTVLNTAGEYVLPLTAFTLSPDRVLFQLSHLPALDTQTAHRPLSQALGQAVMNAGRWLNNQLDDVAQQFAWTLLDPLTPASELRSPTQELESILREVKPSSLNVPSRARAAFTEVLIAAVPLRLYALIWSVFEDTTPEWSLLVFLGPSPGELLPAGLRLRIRDDESVLVEERFEAYSEATYLYAQVFGQWDETFFLEIFPPNDSEPLALPAFEFQPDA
ncbi:MAG: DUF1822 family protein [Leptolyngbya sp. SIOISBB]|nr:DUF1822 family protein [Leptolyngbya sp. SIOISBB]